MGCPCKNKKMRTKVDNRNLRSTTSTPEPAPAQKTAPPVRTTRKPTPSVKDAPTQGEWIRWHTYASKYPAKPTKNDAIRCIEWFNREIQKIGCTLCRTDATTYFNDPENDISGVVMKGKKALERFVFDYHNHVNEITNKKLITWDEYLEMRAIEFAPTNVKKQRIAPRTQVKQRRMAISRSAAPKEDLKRSRKIDPELAEFERLWIEPIGKPLVRGLKALEAERRRWVRVNGNPREFMKRYNERSEEPPEEPPEEEWGELYGSPPEPPQELPEEPPDAPEPEELVGVLSGMVRSYPDVPRSVDMERVRDLLQAQCNLGNEVLRRHVGEYTDSHSFWPAITGGKSRMAEYVYDMVQFIYAKNGWEEVPDLETFLGGVA